jgi:hypothetical protein
MKIKQDIPWYKTKYLDKKDWLVKKSPHYIFHFLKNSLAQEDINKVIKVQEESYKKILRTLKLKNKRKLNYYLYPSKKIKNELMGDDGHGNGIWLEIAKQKRIWKSEKFEVHALYNNKIQCIGAHEDTHLLSLPWGVAIFLFSEGLAEFMSEKWQNKDIDFWAKEYLKKNKLYSIEFLANNKNWDKVNEMIVYPQSGSFIRYLIRIYGIEKFKRVYKKVSRKKKFNDNIRIIKEIYSKSIEKLEKDWKKYLKTLDKDGASMV